MVSDTRDLAARELVEGMMRSALLECCPPLFAKSIVERRILDRAISMATEDALAFADKDPAASNDPVCIVRACTSFRATLHYRLASTVIAQSAGDSDEAGMYSQLIAARGKLLSGAEIHPHSKIGRRFVLDHGMGTVIGQTVEIGDDCYILGGVTLGAVGIAGNPSEKRHPTLGDRVQVGAFSSILGNVSIGDDVFIGARCTITSDIPPSARVTLRSSHSVVRVKSNSAGVALVEPFEAR